MKPTQDDVMRAQGPIICPAANFFELGQTWPAAVSISEIRVKLEAQMSQTD